jgi:hypothetical protein
MRIAVVVAAVGLVFAAGANATTRPSGLYGVVTRAPITPVCRAEEPCSAPAAHVTLLFSHNGHAVARATTRRDGRYRLHLSPGLYTVRRPSATVLDRRLEPDHARVRKGRFIRVDFAIDTGIR